VSAASGKLPVADSAVQPMAATDSGAGHSGNPYGLRVVWAQGDMVARTTLVLLALMSLLSWYVIVSKLLEQRRQATQALSARAAFANADSLQKGATALGKESPFRFLVDSAMVALRKYESLAGQVDVGTWLSQDIVRNVGTLQMRMQSGLSVLATVGSTAPFVGLFGTVWGIYNALVTIGSTGQASIDKVAGPVGEALIMTALGLAVAVPSVLGYNWLVRRNRLALHSVKGFGSDLHTLLLIEIEKSRRGASASKTAV
jgi:biopolymer transport protein ExbB